MQKSYFIRFISTALASAAMFSQALPVCGDHSVSAEEKHNAISFNTEVKEINERKIVYNDSYKEEKFEKVICGENVVEMDDLAFSNCKNLKVVDLSKCKNLKALGRRAFSGCSKLEKILLPEGFAVKYHSKYCLRAAVEFPGHGINEFDCRKFYGINNICKLLLSKNGKTSEQLDETDGLATVARIIEEIPDLDEKSKNMASDLMSLYKKYIDLQDSYANLRVENAEIKSTNKNLQEKLDNLQNNHNTLQGNYANLQKDHTDLQKDTESLSPFLNKFGNQILTQGDCGPNAHYTLTKYGTLTVFGSGEMDNYSQDKLDQRPWHKYISNIRKVSIEGEVSSVGAFAFCGCPSLEYIDISNNVTKINWQAFYECNQLQKVVIPSSVRSVFSCPFPEGIADYSHVIVSNGQCGNTAYFTFDYISGKLNIFGSGKLYDYYDLKWSAFRPLIKMVTIDYGISEIVSNAFIDCYNLQELLIPDTIKRIGYAAFWGNKSLSKICFPRNLELIESKSFGNCNLLSNILIMGEPTIHEDSFLGCSSIKIIKCTYGMKEKLTLDHLNINSKNITFDYMK